MTSGDDSPNFVGISLDLRRNFIDECTGIDGRGLGVPVAVGKCV